MSTPYLRTPFRPTPAEIQASAELAERISAERAEREAFEEASRGRRRELLALGGNLADVEAALACHCSCHPRVVAMHDGGTSCPCQLSDEERQTRMSEALARLSEWQDDDEYRALQAAQAVAFASLAADLEVDIRSHGGAAPFTIHGVVDGRAFYLRERHDQWRVEIAPDEDPLADLERGRDLVTIVVAQGDSADFGDGNEFDTTALECTVRAVRTFLLRRSCPHTADLADGSVARFCPSCGVEVSEAARWQVFTAGVDAGA